MNRTNRSNRRRWAPPRTCWPSSVREAPVRVTPPRQLGRQERRWHSTEPTWHWPIPSAAPASSWMASSVAHELSRESVDESASIPGARLAHPGRGSRTTRNAVAL